MLISTVVLPVPACVAFADVTHVSGQVERKRQFHGDFVMSLMIYLHTVARGRHSAGGSVAAISHTSPPMPDISEKGAPPLGASPDRLFTSPALT